MRRPIVFDHGPNRCFGCGPDNPSGLRLEFVETDEGVELEYVPPEAVAGAPGVVHGGVQATLLDEAMCMTAFAKAGTPVVTGELTVRYLHAAPTGRTLVVSGRITGTKANSYFIEGRIRLAGEERDLARASGRFFAAPRRQAEETRSPASADGAGG